MTRLLLLLVLLAGGGLARAVQWKWEADLDSARATHRAQAHARSETVAERVRFTFTQLYRGLRTIARLPGVRRIGRHAEGFDGDARASVQELYNNLATTVAMSEVYIVPRSLDPEATDPVTGAPETPIATFDELIVGPAPGDDHERGEAVEVEEIEIHEYRLMREQLAHFATSAPRADGRVGFELPALCGREVVTCDNSRYRPDAPDDRDRSGLVYSVPFYGLDDTLAGCISGVLLTHALRDLLPDGNYAIRQGAYGYTAGSQAPGPWSEAAAAVAAGRADDARIYSEVLDLEVRDAGGPWLLWAGLPDEAFWNRADVRASRSAMVASATAVGVFELGGLLGVFLLARGRRQAQRRRAELEERVRGATARVAEAVATLRSSAAALAGESGQLAAANGQITASADAAARQADDVARDAVDVLAGVEGVATSIEELGRTAQGIARSVAESAGRAAVAAEHTTSVDRVVTELGQNVDDIRKLLDVIADIARQTNMLAINAAIEAARAGDSGRGFAVVASQVKDLAGRSAAAATRIHAGTDALGQLSARAVEAIGAIRGIVCAISEAQQGIAAAVEEQSAATDEIQQAASQASTAARSIASTIHDNAQSTAVTKREANGCTESVQRLAELATTVNDTLQRLAVD